MSASGLEVEASLVMDSPSKRATRPRPARSRSSKAVSLARPRRRGIQGSPFTPLRRDHVRVLARLVSLETSVSGRRVRRIREAPLRALIAHLERQFATHMAAEEAVLYPALERSFPESAASLRPLYQEHVELRAMLATLSSTLMCPVTRSREEQVVVQVRDFADLLRLHIRKEEAIVFDVSERVLEAHELRGLVRRLAPFVPASAPRPAARRKSRSHHS